jgi:hypothetical protein
MSPSDFKAAWINALNTDAGNKAEANLIQAQFKAMNSCNIAGAKFFLKREDALQYIKDNNGQRLFAVQGQGWKNGNVPAMNSDLAKDSVVVGVDENSSEFNFAVFFKDEDSRLWAFMNNRKDFKGNDGKVVPQKVLLMQENGQLPTFNATMYVVVPGMD